MLGRFHQRLRKKVGGLSSIGVGLLIVGVVLVVLIQFLNAGDEGVPLGRLSRTPWFDLCSHADEAGSANSSGEKASCGTYSETDDALFRNALEGYRAAVGASAKADPSEASHILDLRPFNLPHSDCSHRSSSARLASAMNGSRPLRIAMVMVGDLQHPSDQVPSVSPKGSPLRTERKVRGQVPEMLINSFVNKMMYARRHGYDFHWVRSIPGLKLPTQHWLKIAAAHSILPSYDWILLVDIDTIIMEMDWRLESLIGEEAGCRTHVIAAREESTPIINTGVVFLHNSTTTLQLLRTMTHTPRESWHTPSFEQGALNYLYKSFPAIRSIVEVRSQRPINPFPPDWCWKKHVGIRFQLGQDWLIHFPGLRGCGSQDERFSDQWYTFNRLSLEKNNIPSTQVNEIESLFHQILFERRSCHHVTFSFGSSSASVVPAASGRSDWIKASWRCS